MGWQFGDDAPHYGATVDAGPVDVSTDWLAARCECAPGALVREFDFEIGIYARRESRAMSATTAWSGSCHLAATANREISDATSG
jgi:hypothetical protein